MTSHTRRKPLVFQPFTQHIPENSGTPKPMSKSTSHTTPRPLGEGSGVGLPTLCACILLAFVLWTIMFSPWTAPHLNFWLCMTLSATTLTAIAMWQGGLWWHRLPAESKTLRYWVENILLGIAIAAVLWGVFWLGDKLSQILFPTFARTQVDGIYGMKDGFSSFILSLLLLFLIGPSEEIFWREFVQRNLAAHLREWKIRDLHIGPACLACILGVLVYALVHLFSLNFMLIMAALVCGLAWGGLYWLWPNRFPAILLSHALWDAAVFIWWPIM